jgi:hypothetical protein
VAIAVGKEFECKSGRQIESMNIAGTVWLYLCDLSVYVHTALAIYNGNQYIS